MSLSGTLEDLSLEDVLQIVGLSRKSGVLHVRCEAGAGRFLLCEGSVRGACASGDGADLRRVLTEAGLAQADCDALLEQARNEARHPVQLLTERGTLPAERVEALSHACVTRAALRMLGWRGGEFRLETGADPDAVLAQVQLEPGIGAPYLAMESARLRDEAASPRHSTGAACTETAAGGSPGLWSAARGTAAARGAPAPPPPLVLVHSDPQQLRWVAASARDLFPRVHAFQRGEDALERTRGCLARGERPLVLSEAALAAEPVGAPRGSGLAAKLKAHAARLAVVLLVVSGEHPGPAAPVADGWLSLPAPAGGPPPAADTEALREALRAWLRRVA